MTKWEYATVFLHESCEADALGRLKNREGPERASSRPGALK